MGPNTPKGGGLLSHYAKKHQQTDVGVAGMAVTDFP